MASKVRGERGCGREKKAARGERVVHKCAGLWRGSNGWKKHDARLGGDRVAQSVVGQWGKRHGEVKLDNHTDQECWF